MICCTKTSRVFSPFSFQPGSLIVSLLAGLPDPTVGEKDTINRHLGCDRFLLQRRRGKAIRSVER